MKIKKGNKQKQNNTNNLNYNIWQTEYTKFEKKSIYIVDLNETRKHFKPWCLHGKSK